MNSNASSFDQSSSSAACLLDDSDAAQLDVRQLSLSAGMATTTPGAAQSTPGSPGATLGTESKLGDIDFWTFQKVALTIMVAEGAHQG
jgi:hypothetical protein